MQHFVETVAAVPQLFVFSQTLDYDESDLNAVATFLKRFEADFVQRQERDWSSYWEYCGQDFILDAWNLKYKDYLADTTDLLVDEKEVIEENQITEKQVELQTGVAEIDPIVVEQEQISWQTLWQQHSEEIYCEQYILYTSIYYNYFVDFKNSVNSQIEDQSVETIENEEAIAEPNLEAELQQLQLLGLPTAFGGRSQTYSKKRLQNKDLHAHYLSTLFSDDDEEDDNVEVEDLNLEHLTEYRIDLNAMSDDNKELSLHTVQAKSIVKSKQKKRNRKMRKVPDFVMEDKTLLKYWRKRFSLFSRFDEGIRLDRESWFSVTPEKVAAHLATRLACDILIDGFCGSGGNAIQFAQTCRRVIAIDIDPLKIEMAKHNAAIYGVSQRIEFIVGDFFHMCATRMRGDIVFLSPPWGGPKYKNKQDFDVERCLLPVGASELVEHARKLSTNVALFLPRNSNVKQIVKIAGVGNRCEIEHNYLDTRLVAITALYGEGILRKDTNTNI